LKNGETVPWQPAPNPQPSKSVRNQTHPPNQVPSRAAKPPNQNPVAKRPQPHSGATSTARHTAHARSSNASENGAARQSGAKGESAAKGADARFLKKYEQSLSPSTRRAHWVSKPGQSPDRDGQTLATRNHEVIQHWAEERGGVPATVKTKKTTDRPRVLRIDFPGYSKNLDQIDWGDWLRTFDKRDLVFLFQETTKDGRQSNFFRLDSPHREDG
jgi:hypothetical protein